MGGGATRAYNIAKGLMLNNCKVTVVTAFPHYPKGDIPKKYRWKLLHVEWFENLKVIRTFVLPLASKGLIRRLIIFLSFALSSLLAIPLVGKINVIWVANPNILSIIPGFIYGLFKICPVALNVDDLWPEDLYSFKLIKKDSFISKIAEFLARIAYQKAKLITPISPGYVKVIVDKYKVNSNKIHVVKAGVDPDKFKPLGLGNGKTNLSENSLFTVLYSGAFSVAYDFDQILMAAKLVENLNIKFVIQGEGELKDYIKHQIKKLGLKNVEVIDKIVSREKVVELLNIADALILPLKDSGKPYLGISSKLYEYQAVGKPIICCAAGQPAEYIKETNSGIVVKPGDYQSLAKAILYLKDNPEITRKLGYNGRQYVEENILIEKIGFDMKRLLEQV